MKILIIVLIVLACIAVGAGIYILYMRHRSKKSMWFEVQGSVVGQKKSFLPGMTHWIVLVQDPFSPKKIVVKTCVWDKKQKPSNKYVYNLMHYKKGNKTIRKLYPANRNGSNN